MRLLAYAIFLVLTSAAAAAAPDPQDLFDQASAAFASGIEATEAGDPNAAQAHFGAAAELYERIIGIRGIDSAALRASAGNAWLLADRPGEAVLAHRRALRLDPSSDVARAGLEAARQRVGVDVPAGIKASWRDRAVALVGAAGPSRLLIGGAMLWALGWAGVGAAITRRAGAIWARAGSAVATAGLALIGIVAAAAWLHSASDEAVILAEHVEARHGPSAVAYEPAFDTPLVAGIEVRVLEERSGWAHIALRDGRRAWVPAEGLAMLHSAS